MSADAPILRRAARVFLIDEQDRLLLLRASLRSGEVWGPTRTTWAPICPGPILSARLVNPLEGGGGARRSQTGSVRTLGPG